MDTYCEFIVSVILTLNVMYLKASWPMFYFDDFDGWIIAHSWIYWRLNTLKVSFHIDQLADI